MKRTVLRAAARTARRLAVLLVVCTLGVTAPLCRAQSAPDAEPVHVRTLSNGLTVVVIEDDAVAVVQTALWFGFGAIDERTGRRGLAHGLARMLFRGTPSLSAAGFDDVVARLGARANVTTANDYTRITLDVPADRLALALRIEADRMQHASLTNAAWNAEKNLLVAEGDAALAPPLGRLYREVCRAASATPICATAPLGDRSDIVATSADDVRSAYRTYDVPSATTLVIAGDVRAADAFALAAAAFDPMVASPAPARPDAAPQFARDVQIRMRGSAPYDVFDVAYPAPGASDARAAAFALLDAALNDERSEMYRALVDGGYVAGFATRWDRDRRGGLYHVFVVVAHDHALETVRTAFLAAIARTRERGISEDLVVAAKSSRIRAAEDAADSIDGIAERVGYAIAVEQSAGPGVEAERVRESTAEEVNAAARIYLATPAATGLLDAGNARDSGPPGAPPDSTNDDFSRRAPLGRSIEAPWIRTALALPETQASGLQPEAFVLPNGLRVLVQPVHANPTVFVSGIVETSPRFEPRAREGIGALASRSFAYDGARYDAVARRRVAETLGASFDFGFAFAAHGRAGDLQAMLDVLADSLATPTFASDDVEAVRADLRERIRFPDPNEVAERDVERLLLRRDDPARRQPSDASLRAISLEDVRAFVRRFVRPDLTTLAVVGDVDPATVRAAVAATFGEWAAPGRTPDVRLPPFATARAARRRVPAGGERIEARFASPACARGSRDFYALAILERLLGNRIAPSATAELRSNRFRGLLEFRLTSTPARLPRAVRALRRAMRELQREPIGAAELRRAESKVVANTLVAEQATNAIATRVREIGLDRLPLDVEAKLPARFAAVGPDDILRVARTYLHPDASIEVDEGPRP